MNGTDMLPTTVVGSRYATRVEVTSDSAFRGWRGVVVRIDHPGSILVRLTVPNGTREVTLPFGESELRVLR